MSKDCLKLIDKIVHTEVVAACMSRDEEIKKLERENAVLKRKLKEAERWVLTAKEWYKKYENE